VEDYDDSFEFRIFGEEYLKFRHFLVPNSFIYVRAFVREGWIDRETGKKGAPRLQYSGMQMLQEVMDKQAKKLTIQLPIDGIQKKRIATLKRMLRKHKGDKQLQFVVYEMEDKLKLTLPSRTQKVKISKELLTALEDEELRFKLN
jgi:DNA polymerase-3 subunit alpha